MLQKLRQILLTQYIGAIVTALMAAQCIQALFSLILAIVLYWFTVWRKPTGLLGALQPQEFNWPPAIYSIVNVFLNAAVVIGLMRWLYFGHKSCVVTTVAEAEPPAPEAPSLNS